MKVLLDSCVWGGAIHELSGAGHDVFWAGSLTVDPGDEELLAKAVAEQRVVVTLDKDFGELAVLQRIRHAGIVRLVGISARKQATTCIVVLARYGEELARGAIVTAEPGRVRIRAAE